MAAKEAAAVATRLRATITAKMARYLTCSRNRNSPTAARTATDTPTKAPILRVELPPPAETRFKCGAGLGLGSATTIVLGPKMMPRSATLEALDPAAAATLARSRTFAFFAEHLGL